MMMEEKSWFIVIDNRNTNQVAKVFNYYIAYVFRYPGTGEFRATIPNVVHSECQCKMVANYTTSDLIYRK